MQIIETLMAECLDTIAAHYANKAKAKNINATEAEIQQAIKNNWPQIQQEVISLYKKTYNEMVKAV